MITADKLNTLTTFTAPMLAHAIQQVGYRNAKFSDARFLGITNAGQFCYEVDYDDEGSVARCKVFLTYDPTAGKVIASY